MADRTKLLHSPVFLRRCKLFVCNRFLNLANYGVKIVKQFTITRVRKINLYIHI